LPVIVTSLLNVSEWLFFSTMVMSLLKPIVSPVPAVAIASRRLQVFAFPDMQLSALPLMGSASEFTVSEPA